MRCLVSFAYACLHNTTDQLSLKDLGAYSGNVLDCWHGEPHHPYVRSAWDLAHAFARERPHERDNGVLIVRDPRDVIVSSYYQRLYREEHKWILPWTTLSDFLRFETGSLKTLLMFMNLWSAVAENPTWTVLRYEDIKACPSRALHHIVNERLCLGVSPQCIQKAVSKCSFDRLQREADKSGNDNDIWQPSDPNNPNSRKVRKGKVGGYRDDLSAEDIDFVEAMIEEHLVGGRIFEYERPAK